MNCKYTLAVCLMTYGGFLYAQDKPELIVTTGHHETIRTISYSKNGRYVASGGNDKILKIYDLNLQQEFNSIAGFSGDIALVRFSSNNKYIFVFSDNHIYTWSHPGGALIHRSNLDGEYNGNVEECSVGSDDKIYISNGSSGLIVYDPIKDVVEKKIENIQTANILFLKKQNLLAGKAQDTVNTDKYVMNFYDATSGQLKKIVPIDGGTGNRMVIDEKEEQIALEYEHGKIEIINAKTFSVTTKFTASTGPMSTMEFYPDGKKIVCVGFDNKVKVFDATGGKMLQEVSAETLNGVKSTINLTMGIMDMEFSPNGKTLAIPYMCIYDNYSAYRVGYYSAKDFTLKHKYDGQNKICLALLTDKEENKLAIGNLSRPLGSRVWNLKKGEIESYHQGSADVKAGGDKLAMFNYGDVDPKNVIRVYEFSTMKLLQEIKTEGYSRLAMSEDGKYVAAFVIGAVKNGMPEMSFFAWDAETGKELFKKPGNVIDQPKNFCITSNNQLLIYFGDRFERWEIPSGKLIKSIKLEGECPYSYWNEFDAGGKEMLYGKLVDDADAFEIKSMNIETGVSTTHIREEMLGTSFAIKFSPDHSKLIVGIMEFGSAKPFKVFVYDWATKKKIKTFDDFTAPVFQINFGLKSGNMYFGDNNGVITIVGNDFTKKAAMLASNEKDYMIISPGNYYKTSITNSEGIGFRYKDELYRFDQFDLKYNRPDVALNALGVVSETQITMYKDAYLKRLKRLGFDEQSVENGMIHSPGIGIVSKDELPYTTATATIKFNVWSSDSLFDLKRMAVYVNNIPLYGKNGMKLDPKTRKFQKEIEIELEEGKNKIAVSVFNDAGVESVRESFITECTQKFSKPDLYILAVGVSKYKDSTMNLTYSDKDVKDITAIFAENNKTSDRFANVNIKLLTNADVTVAKIDEAAAFLKNSKVNDQVVLFYSGHGLIDPKMDYYLATNDVNFTDPSAAGLLYTHFQDFFDDLKARKRLLLIDACHSGEFDKNDYSVAAVSIKTDEGQVNEKEFKSRGKKVIGIGNTNELMKELFTDLRKETGATIIASSSGTEFSVESAQWKNGAFTYALKEGLFDMKADGNKNKEITLSETRDFVIKKVKELTAGKQNPTTRQENIDFDYRIW